MSANPEPAVPAAGAAAAAVATPAVAAAAPSVHFQLQQQQPSASFMQSFEDDAPEEQQPQRGGNKQKGGKQARGAAAAAAAAAASAAAASGNNSSPPVLSVKAERELRKKQQSAAKSAAASAAATPTRSSKSRSPSGAGGSGGDRERQTDGRHHDTEKKRPMRSVEDVLNRIRHDGACKGAAATSAASSGSAAGASASASSTSPPAAPRNFLSHFLIAYIDRVWGDQEIAFDEFFSNSDFKDIPMHRISYIRFFDEIVWSRAARYDAIFGSSNSTKTLPDWLAETDSLRAAQEERWARLLAAEAAEAARDQRMLSQLGVQIAEQREEIEAVQSRADVMSAATSGFDFTESGQRERMQEVEEAEIEEMEREEELQREAEEHAIAQQKQQQQNVQMQAPQDASVAMDFGALPPRENTRRGARAAAAPSSSSSSATPAAPISAAPVAVAAPAPADLFASSLPHPRREDDANISLTLSLFDPSTGRVLRSAALRVSTEYFDWGFLKKRIASRLHIKGGGRDVKRMYLQATAPVAGGSVAPRDNVKLNESNFSGLLKEGCQVIVFAEEESEHPQSMMLQQPKGHGEKMEERDAARVRESRAAAIQAAAAAAASSNPSAPSVQLAAPAAPPAAAVHFDRSRPNYFVSLRITCPRILASLATVQKSLVEYDARYASFLVPQGTFHITLSLLAIANEQQADTAVRVMQENTVRMQQLILGADEEAVAVGLSTSSAAPAGAVSLSIRGLSSFGDKVLFADVARDSARARLNRVALFLTSIFEAAGVNCTEKKREKKVFKEQRGGKGALVETIASLTNPAAVEEEEGFTPHLTIAKMSRAPSAGAGKHNNKFNKNKNNSKPRVQQQNTGMEDVDDAKEDASADSLPVASAGNSFSALALSRDPSTSSDAGAASAASSAAAAPAPAAAARPQSTSVIRRIDSESYSAMVAHDFGTQIIGQIELCSMQGRKQEDGYYFVRGSVQLQQS